MKLFTPNPIILIMHRRDNKQRAARTHTHHTPDNDDNASNEI
jgi:hypothetical protein